jgi:alkanesulfonate monooxygenase SsuD/methylene tetrahydromethanopterin reductase-like flavin-dependent oxidoreductase (luciferase family)
MKYAVNVPNFGKYANIDTLVDLAVTAEKAGWDAFFMWDHIVINRLWRKPFIDPWIALTTIAVKTESIRIGTMVTPLPRRHPWKVARETVSLDYVSKGRLTLGVGLGYPLEEFELFGEESNSKIRAEQLDEALDVITKMWSGRLFLYLGDYYLVDEARFRPKPVQSPRIPIWVACTWPHKKPLQRAARYDGVVPIHADFSKGLTPDHIKDIVDTVTEYRTRPGLFDVVVSGTTPDEKGGDLVALYQKAGATWWSENINSKRGSIKEMKERIVKGPPVV